MADRDTEKSEYSISVSVKENGEACNRRKENEPKEEK
jgi:hypothetical protein